MLSFSCLSFSFFVMLSQLILVCCNFRTLWWYFGFRILNCTAALIIFQPRMLTIVIWIMFFQSWLFSDSTTNIVLNTVPPLTPPPNIAGFLIIYDCLYRHFPIPPFLPVPRAVVLRGGGGWLYLSSGTVYKTNLLLVKCSYNLWVFRGYLKL